MKRSSATALVFGLLVSVPGRAEEPVPTGVRVHLAVLSDGSKPDRDRIRAAKAMAKLGPAAKAARSDLIDLLADDRVSHWVRQAIWATGPDATAALLRAARESRVAVRCAALVALADRHPEAPEVGMLLAGALADRETDVRLAAARVYHGSLSIKIDATGLSALHTLVSDEDHRVRAAAVGAFSRWGRDDGRYPAVLRRATEDRHEWVRAAAVEELSPRDESDRRYYPVLRAAMDDPSALVRAAAVSRLWSFDIRNKEMLQLLHRARADTAPTVRVAAVRVLRQYSEDPAFGATAVPLLRLALSDPEPTVRSSACEALGEFGPRARPAVPDLRVRLTDSDPTVRTRAAIACARCEPAGIAELEVLTEGIGNPRLGAVLRQSAIQSLAQLDRNPEAVVAALLKAGADQDPEVCGAALRAFVGSRFQPYRNVILPLVRSSLAHSDDAVRSAAAFALGQIEPESPTTLAALRAIIVGDEDDDVRAAALGTLATLPLKPDVVVPVLVEAIADPAQRSLALFHLQRLGPGAHAAAPAIGALLRQSPNDRHAIDAIAAIGPAASAAGPDLIRSLDGPDWETRSAAARAIGLVATDPKLAVPALAKALRDPDESTRTAAAGALAGYGRAAREASPALVEMLPGAGRFERKAIAYALTRVDPEKAAALNLQPFDRADHERRLKIAALLAERCEQAGDIPAAITCLEEAVPAAVALDGPAGRAARVLRNKLAELHTRQGRYDQAEAWLQANQPGTDPRPGQEDDVFALDLFRWGEIHQARGTYPKALALMKRALVAMERQAGPENLDTAMILNGIGSVHFELAEYDLATGHYQRAIRVAEKVLPADHPDLLAPLNNLAVLYTSRGEFARAEPVLQRHLQIEARRGKDRPGYLLALINLANLHLLSGQPKLAKTALEEALVRCRGNPALNMYQGRVLQNLGLCSFVAGEFAGSASLFSQALAQKESAGRTHPELVPTLLFLGASRHATGRATEAVADYRRALDVSRQSLGPNHPTTAACQLGLATAHLSAGDYQSAEALIEESLPVVERVLGRGHPAVARWHFLLALSLERRGRLTEAWQAAHASLRGARLAAHRSLPVAPDDSHLAALGETRDSFSGVITLCLRHPHDPQAARLVAEAVLNAKALSHDWVLGRGRFAGSPPDPRVTFLRRQLAEVRDRLATLSFATTSPGHPGSTAQIELLAERERALTKELSLLFAHAADGPWVELDAVRRAVPSDGSLIEFAVYTPGVVGVSPTAPRYAAVVVPPTGRGDVRVFDLGEAAAINRSVHAARAGLAPAAGDYREGMRVLSNLVLLPLHDRVAETARWIISPDADLWLVPWAALPLRDGAFAIERHSVQLVMTGRDVVAPRPPEATGTPLVIGDPDYDAQANSGAGQIPGGAVTGAGPKRWARLTGAREEVNGVAALLTERYGTVPDVLTDGSARKGALLAAVRPKAVVLITHAEAEHSSKEEGLPAGRNPSAPLDLFLLVAGLKGPRQGAPAAAPRHPLTYCYLPLAGANHGSDGSGADNGLLTALEVSGADLRGTDLVVLAACGTGLGRTSSGEGVAGLRQAFHAAGARSVVSTLWQIPHLESTRLTALFFEKLSAGRGKAVALREAQMEFIRRGEGASDHPLFWAAWTVSGEVDTTPMNDAEVANQRAAAVSDTNDNPPPRRSEVAGPLVVGLVALLSATLAFVIRRRFVRRVVTPAKQ